MIDSVANRFARGGARGAFVKLQKGGTCNQDDVADHFHFSGIANLLHHICFYPDSVHRRHQANGLFDMRSPFASEDGIFSAQVIHLAVKETILPKNIKSAFNDFDRGSVRVDSIIRHPNRVEIGAHPIEEFADNFLFVPEVKIQIAGADAKVSGNVIRRDRDDAGLVKEFDTRVENTIAIGDSAHGVPFALWSHSSIECFLSIDFAEGGGRNRTKLARSVHPV